MKLYLITRARPVGYDEYSSFIVRASSEEDAIRISKYANSCDREIEEITSDGEPGVILSDFNAG